jgi:hypothetical protein
MSLADFIFGAISELLAPMLMTWRVLSRSGSPICERFLQYLHYVGSYLTNSRKKEEKHSDQTIECNT